MTTSTHRISRGLGRALDSRHRGRHAFTLTEVIIASTLSALVLAGVLSALVFFGRTGLTIGSYQTMEAELRRGLFVFAEDVRTANDVCWATPWRVQLNVPGSDGSYQFVTYAFEPSRQGSTTGSLSRVKPDGSREVLVHDVSTDFSFKRYKLTRLAAADNAATNDLETKQLQVNLRTLRINAGRPVATQTAISASYILRNKRVSR